MGWVVAVLDWDGSAVEGFVARWGSYLDTDMGDILLD